MIDGGLILSRHWRGDAYARKRRTLVPPPIANTTGTVRYSGRSFPTSGVITHRRAKHPDSHRRRRQFHAGMIASRVRISPSFEDRRLPISGPAPTVVLRPLKFATRWWSRPRAARALPTPRAQRCHCRVGNRAAGAASMSAAIRDDAGSRCSGGPRSGRESPNRRHVARALR